MKTISFSNTKQPQSLRNEALCSEKENKRLR